MSDMLFEASVDRISPLQPAGSKSWDRLPADERAFAKLRAPIDRTSDPDRQSEAYSIALRTRSLAPALLGANCDLRLAHGVLSTALSGLHGAADEMATLRSVLVALAEGESDLAGAGKRAVYASDVATLKACFAATGYAGRNLLDESADPDGHLFSVIVDAEGHRRTIARYPVSSLTVRLGAAATFSAPVLGDFVTQGGGFNDVLRTLGQWINAVEADMNEINQQIAYNSQEIDALSNGLGSLVDTDLTAEAVRLKALRVQQEMTQPRLSITSGTPSTLMALFKSGG